MPFTSREFRSVLGSFATGVTVVTAAPKGFAPFGLTANSFTSLSLDPPLVLWCLDKASEMRGAFAAADHFAINILAEGQSALSQAFARKNDHDLGEVPFEVWETGAPILKDALATLDCWTDQRLDGGDHDIYVGRVARLASREGRPLIYFGGSYRSLAD